MADTAEALSVPPAGSARLTPLFRVVLEFTSVCRPMRLCLQRPATAPSSAVVVGASPATACRDDVAVAVCRRVPLSRHSQGRTRFGRPSSLHTQSVDWPVPVASSDITTDALACCA